MVFPFYICYDYRLRKATKTKKNTSFQGRSYLCKVVEVYDGDTCTVVFRNRGRLEQYSVRMLGYNSPEMRPPKDDPYRSQIIKKAIEAKKALESIILGKIVKIECHKFDKYGRILGVIHTRKSLFPYRSSVDVNKWMLEVKHGVEYIL